MEGMRILVRFCRGKFWIPEGRFLKKGELQKRKGPVYREKGDSPGCFGFQREYREWFSRLGKKGGESREKQKRRSCWFGWSWRINRVLEAKQVWLVRKHPRYVHCKPCIFSFWMLFYLMSLLLSESFMHLYCWFFFLCFLGLTGKLVRYHVHCGASRDIGCTFALNLFVIFPTSLSPLKDHEMWLYLISILPVCSLLVFSILHYTCFCSFLLVFWWLFYKRYIWVQILGW